MLNCAVPNVTDYSGHTLNCAAKRETVSGSLNVQVVRVRDSVCVEKRKRSGACMNYAGCSLECRVLADRVSFSLICL